MLAMKIGGGAKDQNETSVKELLIAVLTEERKISSLLETIVNHTHVNPTPLANNMHTAQSNLPVLPMILQTFSQAPNSGNANVDQIKSVIRQLAETETSLAQQISAVNSTGPYPNSVVQNNNNARMPNQALPLQQTNMNMNMNINPQARNISSGSNGPSLPQEHHRSGPIRPNVNNLNVIRPNHDKQPSRNPQYQQQQQLQLQQQHQQIQQQRQQQQIQQQQQIHLQQQQQQIQQQQHQIQQQQQQVQQQHQQQQHQQQPQEQQQQDQQTQHQQQQQEPMINMASLLPSNAKYTKEQKNKIQQFLRNQFNKQLPPDELSKRLNAYLQSDNLVEQKKQNDEAETISALLGLSGRNGPPAASPPSPPCPPLSSPISVTKKPQVPEQALIKPRPVHKNSASHLPPLVGKSTVGPIKPPADPRKEDPRPAPENENPLYPEGTLLRTFLKPTDMHLVTTFTYAVLSELEVAAFTWRDRRGNRRKLTMGYPGMACRYCKGGTGRTGRYFPSSVKTMADSKKTLFSVYDHLSSCQKCPNLVKKQLLHLFGKHIEEHNMRSKRHGSQRDFFRRVWNALHAKKPE